MKNLQVLLTNLIGLSEIEWNAFQQQLVRKEYKSKEIVIESGKTAQNIYFIEYGLMRTYHLEDGKEINTYFACDDQFISTYSSFISQTPSFEILEAIEESIVYALSFETLNTLYETSSKFEKLGRILAEKNYLCVLDRTYAMQTKSAKEKYLAFIKTNDKKIVQRIPQLHIASFLGIAPESLSRVRKEISIS